MSNNDPRRRKAIAHALDLSTMDNASYEVLINSATELHQWKSQKKEAPSSSEELDSDDKGKEPVVVEFGEQVKLSAPREWLQIFDPEREAEEKRRKETQQKQKQQQQPQQKQQSSSSSSTSSKKPIEEDIKIITPSRATKVTQVYDSVWLRNLCAQHVQQTKTSFPPESLASNINTILLSRKSNDELQGDLFELLGDSFEFIQTLLTNRRSYKEHSKNPQPMSNNSYTNNTHPLGLEQTSLPQQYRGPSVVSSITINLAADKGERKQRKKRCHIADHLNFKHQS